VSGSLPAEECAPLDARLFGERIVAAQRPAVLRGLVRDWPLVRLAQRSPQALCAELVRRDSGAPVDAILMRPEHRGRLFYADESCTAFNFVRAERTLSQIVGQLGRYAQFASHPALAVQSAPVDRCLPGFVDAHPMPLLDAAVRPRIWLGNEVVTPAHFDESSNIACVVAGRRRFTLLPPDQLPNLYLGPLDFAPTPTPISRVDFRAPDLERFPRFAQALAAAQVFELEPGDAIYMPPLWWHHVESLAPLNVLVNYWWRERAAAPAVEAMKRAMRSPAGP
jgi:hypothetical protein